MTQNLDNAFRGVQEARTALRLERDEPNTSEQLLSLVACDGLLNEVEQKILVLENEK